MEKQANNSINTIKRTISFGSIITILFLFTNVTVIGQESSYDDSKKYVLGGLEVTGLESYNEQTVKTYTGLRIGQPITLPGDEISAVINKLWGLELFSDINFYITDVKENEVFLELNIIERPTLTDVTVYGVKKRKVADIIEDTDLKKGKKITESLINNTENYLKNKYRKKGYLNTKVNIATVKDTSGTNSQKMVINIKKGEKVKVSDIVFEGNEQLSSKKLRKAMKNTKKKNIYRFWKKSKYIEDDFQEDLTSLIEKYAEKGYRDARVISDTITSVNDNNIKIKINVEEGSKYYFGNIDFVGNTVYPDKFLDRALGIKKGDVYNGVLLKKRIADNTKPDPDDLSSLYQNNGYMFSSINPVEISAENDTINFEIRIIEGKETFLDHVTVNGNDKTNDHVIYRELRTRPGQKYNKANIIRSIRELGALGFFDAESIKPEIINPNPDTGTVDIDYSVLEAGSSQIELQGGYGGGGFIGTLGLSFSNFSLKNLFNKKAYTPVPMGDGQTFALRLQASRTYRVYSLNFSEPWLGGKKPVQFNMSLSRTQQFAFDYQRRRVDKKRQFSISSISLGLAKRLQWPDDYFVASHSLAYQLYDFKNYNIGLFNFGNGSANSLSYTFGLSRESLAGGKIFPRGGSSFQLRFKATPPYSLFSDKDFKALKTEGEELKEISRTRELTAYERTRLEKTEEDRFKWLEFYKASFKGDWYTTLTGDLVLRSNAEFGFLGHYNKDIGDVPFERYFVGGDGMGNFTMDGRETVQLRGYENQSITPVTPGTNQQEGGVIYNKFSMELRYPITLKPSASIYVLSFLEGANAFGNFNDFNPFQIKRSAGIGLRIFMPAFGLLGIDYGYGFDSDNLPGSVGPNGWKMNFIIGQQF